MQLTGYPLARSILRRYMADYTNTNTLPSTKGGFYALVVRNTGKVYLGETSSFSTLINRNIKNTSGVGFSRIFRDNLPAGSKYDLWLLTQPNRFSAQALEDELFKVDLLLDKEDVSSATNHEGILYVIRHHITNNYFLTYDTISSPASGILTRYLNDISKKKLKRNKTTLNNFITEYAGDILNQRGFGITEIKSFKNVTEREQLQNEFISNNVFGVNLNT